MIAIRAVQGHNKTVMEHAKLSGIVKQVFTLDPTFGIEDLDTFKLPKTNVRVDLVPELMSQLPRIIYHSCDLFVLEKILEHGLIPGDGRCKRDGLITTLLVVTHCLSVGKAKATHAAPKFEPAPKPAPAAAAAAAAAAPQAAVTGAPSPENVEEGTVRPLHQRGQVESYKHKLDENINGEVVEHVVVDSHPYELVTKTCWQMEGAEKLRWPGRLTDHRTKVNAVTRGQPGRNTSKFDEEMWLDLEDFFEEYNQMLPKKIQTPTVEELIALLYYDNKCRFEFRCVAGLQLAARKGLAFWPFKIRAVQGHSKKAVQKAAATDTFNATLVYAGSGAIFPSKVSFTGKLLATLDETPGVIYLERHLGEWVRAWWGRTRFKRWSPQLLCRQKSGGQPVHLEPAIAQRPVEIREGSNEGGISGRCHFHQDSVRQHPHQTCHSTAVCAFCGGHRKEGEFVHPPRQD